MDKLWAPWRTNYLSMKKPKKCIFCTKSKSKLDKKNYIVMRGTWVFSMLNIFPYTNGHIMIAPYRHIKDFNGLNEREIMEMMEVLKKSCRFLDKVLKPQGYNIGINIGKVSGAGVGGHLHIHVVPRWRGDTNFMPIISQTKVISESLDSLYEKLKNNKNPSKR